MTRREPRDGETSPRREAATLVGSASGEGGVPTPPDFEARDLRFRYPGAERSALDGVTMAVPRGSTYAVIGPNGSGKSTLLKALLGAIEPDAGRAAYRGRRVAAWDRRKLARSVGVVPQIEEAAFPLSVREMVGMGRYPHLGVWERERPHDRSAVRRAMEACAVTPFADRAFDTLSGGERQRVRIARALAQEPETLVLDEPTVSLDIRHQMSIFELLRDLAVGRGITVLLVTHHLNLASRYASELLLLHRGRPVAEGPPPAVLTKETVERVYGWRVSVDRHPGPGPDAGAPRVVPLADSGGDR